MLAFLLDKTKAQWQWTAETPLSLELLERDKVIENMLEFNNQEVQLRQMYPMYEYINLQGDKLEKFYRSITDPLDLDSYTTDTPTDKTFCQCTKEENDKGLHCEGVTQLLDNRMHLDMQFLRQKELLYLVLLILQ